MRNKAGPMSLEEVMGASRRDLIGAYAKHVNPAYAKDLKLINRDKLYRRAEGLYLFDEEGRRYADLTGGYGVANLGHNPREVVDAIREAYSFPSVVIAGCSPLAGALAYNLASILPGDLSTVIFGSGGAEAVELAMRTARGSTKRKKFVSCEGGYHGLTFGAISLCGSPKYAEHLGPLMPDCEKVPFGDSQALEIALRGRDVAGFVVEPVQAEGGARVPPEGYLRTAEEICRKYGTLLILDEVQTGFGRTGKMFALEHDKLTPDIVVLSKALGSGVIPISAAVTTPDIWDKAFAEGGNHEMTISTFGGNAPACVAAMKTIEIMRRDNIPERAAASGELVRKKLQARLDGNDHFAGIAGKGLLLGVKLELPREGANENVFSGTVISRLINEMSTVTAIFDYSPTTLRYEPPLIITEKQIDESVDAFGQVLDRSSLSLTLAAGKDILKRRITGH